jgi:putative methyltransferase
MHNLYLFQPQYNFTFKGIKQNWLPYSVGCLWAYAKQFASVVQNWQLKEIFFQREHCDKVLERISDPSVCAFSCYVWNEKYCLKLAELIKLRWPKCVIVFGGPQVTGDYTKYKFVDCIVLKEGENNFVKILDTVFAGQELDLFYQLPRMETLNGVPSPYASGVFDSIIEQHPDIHWSAVIETNRGCPYSCTFCDWGGLIGSKVKLFDMNRITCDLDWMKNVKIRTLFIADANFGIFKERDSTIAKKIGEFAKDSSIEFISLNYAKNSNEEVFKIATLLGQVNKGITFSVQTMNPDTLKIIKRKNMGTNDISHLLNLSKQYAIPTYTEIILGLPLETVESWKQGIMDIIELGQHDRLEPQLGMILPNTEMFTEQKKLFALDTIPVKDFVPFADDNETGIFETAEMVRATSTMSNEQLIESWMFSWMVLHMHYSGYSQVLAKYVRKIHGKTYREYYDLMFNKIQNMSGPLNTEFLKIKTALTNMYKFGETLDKEIKASNILFASLYFFYTQIEQAVNLATDVAKELVEPHPGMIELQQRFVQNNIWTAPCTVDCDIDIQTWTAISTQYQILNKTDQLLDTYESFFVNHRRHGGLRSYITKAHEIND